MRYRQYLIIRLLVIILILLPQYIFGSEMIPFEELTEATGIKPQDFDISEKDWTFENPVARLLLAHALEEANLNQHTFELYYSVWESEDLSEWYYWTDKFLNDNPENYYAYILKAHAYFQYGLYDSAIVLLNKSIELKKDNAVAYHRLGIVKYMMGDNAKALLELEKCISIKDNYAEAYYHLGLINQKMKNYNAAISYYERAIQISPYDLKPYLNNAFCHIFQDRYREALPILDSLLSIDSTFFLAYLSKGNVCRTLGMIEEAINSFKMLIKYTPTQTPPALGFDIRQFEDTIKILEKSLSNSSNER